MPKEKSLLQTKEWSDFKISQGWQTHDIEGIRVLGRKLFLNSSFLYAPEVTFNDIKSHPESNEGSPTNVGIADKLRDSSQAQNDINNFITKIQKIVKKNNTIFLRLEILDENQAEIIEKLQNKGFIKAFEETQPEYRQIIDITKSEDEILAQMKEKGRYNIRIAQRHGVKIEKSQNINDFYQIFLQTAKRDGFEIRPKKYFSKLLEILQPKGMAELLIAKYQGKIIAAEIITYYYDTASYLYGASANANRQVMAPYLLHWEAMKRAKQKECKFYDLLAVDPPSHPKLREGSIANATSEINSEIPRDARNDNSHKYAGIGRFKRQFGGRTVCLVGGWDLIYKPFWYKIFKMAEKIRRH